MLQFFSYLINGISLGSVYAIIALGYSMVYGIAKMLNFAHGDVIMVGAYISFCVTNYLGLPVVVSILAAMAVCTLLGVLIEGLAYKPLRGTPSLAVLITAIGVSYFLQNAAQLIWSSSPKNFTSIVTFQPLRLAGGQLVVTGEVIYTIAASVIIMLGLTWFTTRTRTGKAMRAVSEDRDAAQLMGINVNQTISMTFAIGSGLAAVAALMYCSTYPRVTTDMGSMMGMKAFIAAVLGGIGIIPGAMIGGILVGLIEIFVKLFAPGWYEAVTYGTLIVILLVKPAGILGKNTGEKV